MFRIIRFEIDQEALIASADVHMSTVRALQEIGELGRYDGAFSSKAMATTSPGYFEMEQRLRSLFGDGGKSGKWQVIDHSKKYGLLRTRAPKEYDYGYCVEIGTIAGENGPERLVAMPADRVEYQSGRYSSGLFCPVNCS